MTQQVTHQEKKVDTKEVVEMLSRLPEEEKFKIFYVIQGAVLVSKGEKRDDDQIA